ncbi:3-dehydroquinate synthase [Alkalihalobacillus sp. LMS39]|uniref:3-dehydroquinate synthase n=1 Tax=Alkalihalobacillus sp. LMS39 TaxID=2924032 RepID=UPI001FB2977A|nr:3-dehydroquinate synthase [Alkalihalobacillus sp. LMS39]UOE95090.1 3-dehydroquinate synthase [Alkalihalobacillus sp. LMS39]
MTKFHVELKRVVDNSYSIEIGRSLFNTLIKDLKNGLIKGVEKYALITDSNVKEKYGNKLLNDLKLNGFTCSMFSFPAGEKSKNRDIKAQIEDQLLEQSFGRDSCIIALGGGAVSDLAGFIASTFCRGIEYINYSTTLLSAADASVGGKTAVNTPVATNLIGTFYQPKKVYIDLDTWFTLPIREFRSGLAETIKHACISDHQFFEYLEKHLDKLIISDQLILDPKTCEYIALKNCQIKYEVVERDEKETNLRQVLNLGHTCGRAIEALSNYELLHGEAIATGLLFQSNVSKKLNLITEDEHNRIKELLTRTGFKLEVPNYISNLELLQKMYTDKKVRNGKIRFVLLERIGKVKQFEDGWFSTYVDEQIILETINEMR